MLLYDDISRLSLPVTSFNSMWKTNLNLNFLFPVLAQRIAKCFIAVVLPIPPGPTALYIDLGVRLGIRRTIRRKASSVRLGIRRACFPC